VTRIRLLANAPTPTWWPPISTVIVPSGEAAVTLPFLPGLLEFLETSSITPGKKGKVTAASPDGTMTVEIGGHHVGVGAFASSRILVTR